MTRRMSLVAVCVSSAVSLAVARLQLGEQPHVFDGDDGLVGEGLEQLDLLVGKWSCGFPADRDRSNGMLRPAASARQGRIRSRWHARAPEARTPGPHVCRGYGRWCGSGWRGWGCRLPALDATGTHHDSSGRAFLGPRDEKQQDGSASPCERGRSVHNLASHRAEGAGGDAVEHRLDIVGGARDDTQDLARRRLLLEGLRQVLVTGLQLLEQAHVLDGDHGLVGEGLLGAGIWGVRRTHRAPSRWTTIAPTGSPSTAAAAPPRLSPESGGDGRRRARRSGSAGARLRVMDRHRRSFADGASRRPAPRRGTVGYVARCGPAASPREDRRASPIAEMLDPLARDPGNRCRRAPLRKRSAPAAPGPSSNTGSDDRLASC